MAFISRGANNFIKSIVVHGCARPWYVYVETFVPCFLKLALTVSFFDMEDWMRMTATHIAGTPGAGPGRKKRPRSKLQIATKPTTMQRYSQNALKTMLFLTAPLEAIGFAWLLYAATDQFFFDWATMIERSDFCEQPIESGPLIRTRGPGQIGILIACDVVPMATLEQNRAAWATSVFGVDLPEGWMLANYALTVEGPPGGLSGIYLQLSITTSLGPLTFKSDPVDIGAGEIVDLVMSQRFFITFPGNGHMGWEICGASVPAGIWCEKGIVTCQRTG